MPKIIKDKFYTTPKLIGMMAIIHKTDFGFLHWCEGCGNCHGIWLNKPNEMTGAKWQWNGSLDKPTFTPSVVIKDERDGKPFVCHSFVTNGEIIYLNDSTHHLSGKTVPLEDF